MKRLATVILIVTLFPLMAVLADGMPPNSIQLIENSGFEDPNDVEEPGGWDFYGLNGLIDDPRTGNYAMFQSGDVALTGTTFDLQNCKPGPVWVWWGYKMHISSEVHQPDSDITQAWLSNSQGASLSPYLQGEGLVNGMLWTMYADQYDLEWVWPNMVRIDNLFSTLYPESTGQLWIGSSNIHDDAMLVRFQFDDVEMYCEPKDVIYDYQVFLPMIQK